VGYIKGLVESLGRFEQFAADHMDRMKEPGSSLRSQPIDLPQIDPLKWGGSRE
jgi:hypothetical protein